MLERSNIIYVYDGSFDGLLTAVFESFKNKEIPSEIVSENDFIPTLFAVHRVVTDENLSLRVKNGVKRAAGSRAYNAVRLGYLTNLDDKGALINDFIHMAMQYGEGVTRMLADYTVNRLFRAVKALNQESHKYLGFVRFSESDGFLTSVIEPKNQVLPIIANHFCDRYPEESFMIFDKTHSQALIWHNHTKAFIEIDNLEINNLSENEQAFQALWKSYYDTMEIKARHNERCRMSFMPKRYWNNLPEMQNTNNLKKIKSA